MVLLGALVLRSAAHPIFQGFLHQLAHGFFFLRRKHFDPLQQGLGEGKRYVLTFAWRALGFHENMYTTKLCEARARAPPAVMVAGKLSYPFRPANATPGRWLRARGSRLGHDPPRRLLDGVTERLGVLPYPAVSRHHGDELGRLAQLLRGRVVRGIERANGLYGKWLARASKHRVGNGNDVTAFLEDSQCLDGSALLFAFWGVRRPLTLPRTIARAASASVSAEVARPPCARTALRAEESRSRSADRSALDSMYRIPGA